MSSLITRHANKAHLGIRDHRQRWIHHAQTGTNDRHDNGRILQTSPLRISNRGADWELLNCEITRRLIHEHGAEICKRSTESRIVSALIAHDGKT
ncbi:hypothetical protein FRC0259_00664 [Corynebacterium diphtheriae]|nr:hypothetical protein FRC0259_00664 [Corynebacterium diphtheriae]